MVRYYLTQDHFHYDDSGYYGYILFSGTKAELHGLLNGLGRGDKEHGFGWHRWGRSFRPADNGIVYDYYIRLRSKTDPKPTQRKYVDNFLRKETLPPKDIPPAAAPIRGVVASVSPESTSTTPENHDRADRATLIIDRLESLESKLATGLFPLTHAIAQISKLSGEFNEQIPQLNDSFSNLSASTTQLSENLVRRAASIRSQTGAD